MRSSTGTEVRVVVDPNVLLSALIAPGGRSDQAVRAAVSRTTLIISSHLIERFVKRAAEEKFRRWFSIADARVCSCCPRRRRFQLARGRLRRSHRPTRCHE